MFLGESHEFGEWVEKHGTSDQLYTILVDTDLTREFETLKVRFNYERSKFVIMLNFNDV